MRLTVVGCAGSFPSPESAASCYLVQADGPDAHGGTRTWSLLLDLGSGALGPLQAAIDPRRLDAAVISHQHADHCADLAVLAVYLRYHPGGARTGPLPVHGPTGFSTAICAMAGQDAATGVDGAMDLREATAPFRVGPMLVEPITVRHPVPALGFRVTGPSDLAADSEATIGYSGDTDECDGLDRVAAGVDLLLAEAAFVDGRDDAITGLHLTGSKAGSVATRNGARRLLVTHIPSWTDPDVTMREARSTWGGPLERAVPGAVHLV